MKGFPTLCTHPYTFLLFSTAREARLTLSITSFTIGFLPHNLFFFFFPSSLCPAGPNSHLSAIQMWRSTSFLTFVPPLVACVRTHKHTHTLTSATVSNVPCACSLHTLTQPFFLLERPSTDSPAPPVSKDQLMFQIFERSGSHWPLHYLNFTVFVTLAAHLPYYVLP